MSETNPDSLPWYRCYSLEWEVKQDFNGIGVRRSFPDGGEENLDAIMEQILAIHHGLADMPDKRFLLRTVVLDIFTGAFCA